MQQLSSNPLKLKTAPIKVKIKLKERLMGKKLIQLTEWLPAEDNFPEKLARQVKKEPGRVAVIRTREVYGRVQKALFVDDIANSNKTSYGQVN